MKKQKSMFFSNNAEKYTWRTLLLEIVMLVICCIVVLPFYYLFVSVFKTTREMGLNPLGLPGSLYLGVGEFTNNWPLMMSIMVLIISPLVLFYIFAQRFIIEGLTSGAVKG